MRKIFFLFLWLSCLPYATRGQTIEDIDLSELLQPIQAKALCYWYDDNTDDRLMVNNLSSNYTLDVSSLKDGLHILYYQVIGTDNISYGTTSQIFFKMTALEEFSSVTLDGAQLKYWYDEDTDNIKAVNNLLGIYSLDVSSLSDGLHTLHALLVGADGTVCSTMSDVFIKDESIQPEESLFPVIAARRVAYWFDDDVNNIQVSKGLSGTYKIDASSLSDGLHLLHYYVVGEDGLSYGITSSMFLKNESIYAQKIPNGITKYTYWLNDCSTSVQTVTLDKTVNPYTLMALLPAPHQPIRSTKFHFQVEDGVPTIYAKNDFHIRFYDARGEFVDNFMEEEKTYVDYGVSQQVTGTEQLEPGKTITIDKPADNTIKWYSLNVEQGDSLEFKLDHAATIQLFSPSGEEVYNASGAESVKWGGCHAWERGIYYLALHDVTAKKGNTISLDYNHIDKYAILNFDVNEIGVAESFVPITIQGNGFDKIENISLSMDGNVITTDQYVVVNKGRVEIFFALTGEELLGDYTLNITFNDDENGLVTVASNSSVHLVAPRWDELKVEVTSYLTTVSKTYAAIKVKNLGNVAHLYTPLTFSFEKPGAVSHVDFENFFVVMSKELQEESYNPVVWTEDFAGKGIEAESMFLFIPSIKPLETITFNMSYDLSDDIRMYATIGKSLNREVVEMKQPSAGENQVNPYDDKCTMAPSLVEYMLAHTAPNEDDHIESLIENKLSKIKSHFLEVFNNAKEAFNNAIGCGKMIANLQNAIQVKHFLQVTEVSDYYTEEEKKVVLNSVHLEAPSDILKDAGHPFLGAGSALLEWQQLKSKCDEGGLVFDLLPIRRSLDPNDIIGYTAESGSKAIKERQTDVSYTIEFENDPEFATASAHTIVITDSLDKDFFDFTSFASTGIKIGEKFVEFDNEKNFSGRTIDLRPQINVIAEISQSFDEQTGIAKWIIKSLDPMTMEPTVDVLQGVLPINTDGLGIGEILFNISLKDGLANGTEIPNKATIVFDTNEPIETPMWVNTIDTIRPTSHIVEVTKLDGQTAEVTIEAMDELSGPWRYDVYVQYGPDAPWWKVAENVPADTTAAVRIYKGIDHGFYVVATDSAGNVERKEPIREITMNVPPALRGDVNDDEEIGLPDVMLIVNYILGISEPLFIKEAADVNKDGEINMSDVMFIINYITNGKFPDEE